MSLSNIDERYGHSMKIEAKQVINTDGYTGIEEVLFRSSSPSSLRKFDLTHFAVITVIFNPMRYQIRYDLYQKFHAHIARAGVTLLTVECIFEREKESGLPKQKFQLTQAENPLHLQITAPSVLWLKENLINIAVQYLPTDIEYVAWLDADIEFERLDWPQLTIQQLQRYSIVQLFQSAFFLGPSGKKQILRNDFSFVYAMQHGKSIDAHRPSDCYVHPGYAWAMRRETFDRIGGLLEFSLLGAGDVHFAYALFNRIDETLPNGLHEDYRRLVKLWADRVARVSGHGFHVGYVPINLWHHWHGNREHRGYEKRWSALEQHEYSPLIDLEKNDLTGLIRLTDHQRRGDVDSAKRVKRLQDYLIRYFQSRHEGKEERPISTVNIAIKSSKPIVSSKDVFRPTDDLLFHHYTSSIEDIHNESRVRSSKKSSERLSHAC